ncbi:MAG: hypothetical protein HC769_34130 [Cyanobacteria bacterium CRU_2_1]|nr:hypothetical protein [Cyanobacteria bacterium CRU_2_1]
MKTCPCCSDRLLRHVRQSTVYWFCPACWQEMPVWDAGVQPIVCSRSGRGARSLSKNAMRD